MIVERTQYVMPRTLVKWLDSLDLSYEVRNPRKDLATGYLAAEIVTRYFPKEVSIYSFHNSQAKDKRHNNWLQVQAFLAKKGFVLDT
jgi:hypothetical protein